MFQAEIKTRLTLRQSDFSPQTIVILSGKWRNYLPINLYIYSIGNREVSVYEKSY